LELSFGTCVDASCGWHGTVGRLLELDQANLLDSLHASHLRVMDLPPSGEHREVWRGGSCRRLDPQFS
jgi:hypothetical protein